MSDRAGFWVNLDGVVMDVNAIHYIEPAGSTTTDGTPLTRVHFVACLQPFIYKGSVTEFCERMGIVPATARPAASPGPQDAL